MCTLHPITCISAINLTRVKRQETSLILLTHCQCRNIFSRIISVPRAITYRPMIIKHSLHFSKYFSEFTEVNSVKTFLNSFLNLTDLIVSSKRQELCHCHLQVSERIISGHSFSDALKLNIARDILPKPLVHGSAEAARHGRTL